MYIYTMHIHIHYTLYTTHYTLYTIHIHILYNYIYIYTHILYIYTNAYTLIYLYHIRIGIFHISYSLPLLTVPNSPFEALPRSNWVLSLCLHIQMYHALYIHIHMCVTEDGKSMVGASTSFGNPHWFVPSALCVFFMTFMRE